MSLSGQNLLLVRVQHWYPIRRFHLTSPIISGVLSISTGPTTVLIHSSPFQTFRLQFQKSLVSPFESSVHLLPPFRVTVYQNQSSVMTSRSSFG